MDGERLKILRKEKQLTQQQLAQHIGVGDSTIRMIEINKRNGSIEVLSALSDFFDVSMDFLEGKTEYRNSFEIAKEIVNQLKKLNLIKNDSELNNEIIELITKHVSKNIIIDKHLD